MVMSPRLVLPRGPVMMWIAIVCSPPFGIAKTPDGVVGVPVRGLVSHASLSYFGGLFVKSRGIFIHEVLFAPVNVPHRGVFLVDVPVDEPS